MLSFVSNRVRPPTDATTAESTSPWQIDEEYAAVSLRSGGLDCIFGAPLFR